MTSLLQRIRGISRRRFLKLGFELVLILAMLFAVRTFQQRSLVNGDAPPLSGELLSGQIVTLDAYRGKPLLLHFWATWCSICKMEESGIALISEDYAVLTVAMNSGNRQVIQAYLDEQGVRFPVLVDEHGILAQRYGVRGVPTSFVINPNGEIMFTEVGYTTGWGLRLRLLAAGL